MKHTSTHGSSSSLTFRKPDLHSKIWIKHCTYPLPLDYLQSLIIIPSHRAKKDLPQLSSLGHFLKGSSAALGVSRVSSACQKIEQYGKLRDEKNNRDLSKDEALSKIGTLLKSVGSECSLAEQWLTRWYEDQAA